MVRFKNFQNVGMDGQTRIGNIKSSGKNSGDVLRGPNKDRYGAKCIKNTTLKDIVSIDVLSKLFGSAQRFIFL